MTYIITTATTKIANLSQRIRAIPGGTSSSKTISILLYLIASAQSDTSPTLASVVSESMPHLRKGAMRDFLNIMKDHKYFKKDNCNATNSTYTFETGSQIEFFSADSGDKLRGARRDRLFINEANNISFEAFEQLEMRTKEYIFLDWNPSNSFWYYEQVKGYRDDVEELTLTYIDNEALDKSIVASIEKRKNRANWWRVYGLGQLGELEEKIYKDWQIIKEIPHEARLIRRGLDFGYTNDPSAIVELYEYNGGYIANEILYQKGMSNKQIADFLLSQEHQVLVMADLAEPKSIDEIRSYGVNILGASKGAGSIMQGISYIQDQRMSITERSLNLIKEYRNYTFKKDRDGKVLNEPIDYWNHILDALRYSFDGIRQAQTLPIEEITKRLNIQRKLKQNFAH
ncbi:MAG: terminase [Bacteroidales bacterium]|nr:terminase [Bacteroidales bacterium]